LRTAHNHIVPRPSCQSACFPQPQSKTAFARRPHISSTELVEVPVPCATCRGHSHFLRSFSISPFGANSRAARLLHSSPFRYHFIPFHSAAPHSITPFRNPHGFISFSQRWLKAVFPFLVYGYWIEDSEQNNISLVLVKMTSYWCCEYIPPFFKRSCITSIHQSSNPFYPQCQKRSFIVMHVLFILSLFLCLMAPIVRSCFSIFGSGVSRSIGSVLVGSFVCSFLISFLMYICFYNLTRLLVVINKLCASVTNDTTKLNRQKIN